jgi:hypothetical protein
MTDLQIWICVGVGAYLILGFFIVSAHQCYSAPKDRTDNLWEFIFGVVLWIVFVVLSTVLFWVDVIKKGWRHE